MPRFVLTLDLDGAAFDGDASPEVARILRAAALIIDARGEYLAQPLFDANGNACGTYRMQHDAEPERATAPRGWAFPELFQRRLTLTRCEHVRDGAPVARMDCGCGADQRADAAAEAHALDCAAQGWCSCELAR